MAADPRPAPAAPPPVSGAGRFMAGLVLISALVEASRQRAMMAEILTSAAGQVRDPDAQRYLRGGAEALLRQGATEAMVADLLRELTPVEPPSSAGGGTRSESTGEDP